MYFGDGAAAALPDLRDAVRLDSANPEAHRTLAAALRQTGDAAGALDEMVEALALQDDHPDYHVESALIRRDLGDLPEAIADLDAAVALRPDVSYYYTLRAYLRYEQGDYTAALADVGAALELNPNDAAAMYVRGLAYTRLTDYERALADLDAVQARQPFEYSSPLLTLANLREINLDRALVLQAMPGREADALAAFDLAAEAQPDWFAVYFYRGVYLAERGQTATARADLELAAGLASDAVWQARVQEQLAALGD
jgi:tetratricopeptide (TPR) repeat protein